MKKTILFLLVLTFGPTTEGKERIAQYFLDKVKLKEKQNDVNRTESKNETDGEQAKNDKSDKALGKVLDKTSDEASDKEKRPVSAWVGYNYYTMNEFNRKLSGEGNKTIDGGLNVGIEFDPKALKVGVLGLEFSPFPIGVEYLDASSKTTHRSGGTRTTVDWEFPVVGIYFWPEVHFRDSNRPKKQKDQKDHIGWRLRPLGVGYYTLGKLIDAELDVSDSPGYLEVEDETIGIMSQIGIKYVNAEETFEVFVESGYRWLKFTSVMREPKGGFAGGSPSTMPEDLDYSGFIIKAGLCMRF